MKLGEQAAGAIDLHWRDDLGEVDLHGVSPLREAAANLRHVLREQIFDEFLTGVARYALRGYSRLNAEGEMICLLRMATCRELERQIEVGIRVVLITKGVYCSQRAVCVGCGPAAKGVLKLSGAVLAAP